MKIWKNQKKTLRKFEKTKKKTLRKFLIIFEKKTLIKFLIKKLIFFFLRWRRLKFIEIMHKMRNFLHKKKISVKNCRKIKSHAKFSLRWVEIFLLKNGRNFKKIGQRMKKSAQKKICVKLCIKIIIMARNLARWVEIFLWKNGWKKKKWLRIFWKVIWCNLEKMGRGEFLMKKFCWLRKKWRIWKKMMREFWACVEINYFFGWGEGKMGVDRG